jgi:hypothetical protein
MPKKTVVLAGGPISVLASRRRFLSQYIAYTPPVAVDLEVFAVYPLAAVMDAVIRARRRDCRVSS